MAGSCRVEVSVGRGNSARVEFRAQSFESLREKIVSPSAVWLAVVKGHNEPSGLNEHPEAASGVFAIRVGFRDQKKPIAIGL